MSQALDKISIVFHWAVALGFIGVTAIGVYMADGNDYSLYDTHKSLGILLFAVILARVAWRLKKGWPKPVRQYERIEQSLSKAVHWVLILGTVIMPISGMTYSTMSGHGIGIFAWRFVPDNVDLNAEHGVEVRNAFLDTFAHTTHEIVGYVLIAAIVLHVAGALKHHMIDKDGTLRRMLGRTV